MNPYMHICPGPVHELYIQEHWDSDLFCFGDSRIRGVFPLLLRVVSKRTDLPHF